MCSVLGLQSHVNIFFEQSAAQSKSLSLLLSPTSDIFDNIHKMPVSENETALSRGRVLTYMRCQLNDLMAVLLRSNSSHLRVADLSFFK
jgi:hypothetical protein